MSNIALRDELTNYRRSLAELGLAFIEAAALMVDDDDNVSRTRLIERAMVRRDDAIDFLAADLVLRCVVGLLAGKSGVGPQKVLDEHFKSAPTDRQWEEMKRAANDR